MNKQKIVKNLTKAFTFCLCCVFCAGVLCSTALTVYGADEPSDGGGSARITDLTGYTVSVPSGWSTEAGAVSAIYFSGSMLSPRNGWYFAELSLGYNEGTPSNNYITFERDYAIQSNQSFTFTVAGGLGATYSPFIQWLYDNNATFVNNNEPPTSITKQFYIEKQGQTYTLEFEEGMTLADWANSTYDTLGYALVDGYDYFDGAFILRQFVVSRIDDSDTCSTSYTGLEQKGGHIPSSRVITEGDVYFDTMGLILYNECFATGYNEGYEDGYGRGEYLGHQTGYNEGFVAGKTEGQSSNIGENLIGSGFSAITGALNQIIVYQSSTGTVVTLWVIISGAVGIALFIWILKLFAGG